jgi:hypothetical protein
MTDLYCANCAHVRRYGRSLEFCGDGSNWACGSPKNFEFYPVSLVTGQPEPQYNTCEQARLYEVACGKNGNWYIPRQASGSEILVTKQTMTTKTRSRSLGSLGLEDLM